MASKKKKKQKQNKQIKKSVLIPIYVKNMCFHQVVKTWQAFQWLQVRYRIPKDLKSFLLVPMKHVLTDNT